MAKRSKAVLDCACGADSWYDPATGCDAAMCKTNCSAYTTTTTTTTAQPPLSTTTTTTRSPGPPPCQNFRRVEGETCADVCLRSRVGICSRGIVVTIGSLEAGSCKDLWANAIYDGTMAQQAGPCGSLDFVQYRKPSVTGQHLTCQHTQDADGGEDKGIYVSLSGIGSSVRTGRHTSP